MKTVKKETIMLIFLLMLISLLACVREETLLTEGDKAIHLIYGNNMDGEIEPCG